MFDVAPTELIVLGTVALMVIPPKDLPRAMRVAGYWVGRARGVARQFRSGFDNIIRDAELAEMEQRWKAENERIMREHPATPVIHDDHSSNEALSESSEPAPVMVGRPDIVDAPTAEHSVTVVAPAAADTPPAADVKAPS